MLVSFILSGVDPLFIIGVMTALGTYDFIKLIKQELLEKT